MNPFNAIGSFVNNLVPHSTTTYTAQPSPNYNVRGVALNDQDLATARKVLFAEISNRDPAKQALEARTILNTAINRVPQYQAKGKSMTLHDVLTEPNQYQGYNSPEYQRISNNATTTVDAPKLKAIDDTLAQLKTGTFPDNTGDRVFYHHDSRGRILTADGALYKEPRDFNSLIQ